jgi:uncharacterized membrane-anchored protein
VQHWYSNDRLSWILVRGLIVAALGAIVAALLELDPYLWLGVLGVPILLTAVNVASWRKSKKVTAASPNNLSSH